MVKSMEIHLPDDIAHYEGDLRYFFDSMVRKLYVNRDRGFGDNCTAEQMIQRVYSELDEYENAKNTESQFAAYMELVDVSNFAFLAALITSQMLRVEFDAKKPNGGVPPLNGRCG